MSEVYVDFAIFRAKKREKQFIVRYMDEYMYPSVFDELKRRFLDIFSKSLSPSLSYHNALHTLDVLTQAQNIAKREGIEDPEKLFLLQVASLTHDSGFTEVYFNHEEKSCEIMRREMARYHFPEEKLHFITDLIMATRMPQQPKNHLQEILCDADLDYLGRDDFFEISDRLKKELKEYDILKDDKEWDKKQVEFLEAHHYFTKSSQALRAEKKQSIINLLKAKIEA